MPAAIGAHSTKSEFRAQAWLGHAVEPNRISFNLRSTQTGVPVIATHERKHGRAISIARRLLNKGTPSHQARQGITGQQLQRMLDPNAI